ncbi:GNAT family N-acetyltransferase [Candidatus Jorgensenbacteria bacterium]|nr:GNAT family N-acetyltransferase [Candidatus Jorgensenbacteria bacterium]
MNRGLTPEELKHIIILKGGDDPDNQIILGCLVALPISEKTMYLSRMKIGKPFRKNKLASELLAHALHDAKDRKFSFAFAVTLSEKAARLLQKFNAEEINRYDFFKEIPQSIAQRNCPCSENHRYWRIRI